MPAFLKDLIVIAIIVVVNHEQEVGKIFHFILGL